MKDYTTNPAVRARFTRSLRDLASYLDQHPAVPVPAHGATLTLYASGHAEVDRIARLMDTGTCDETAHGGHYWTTRSFGSLGYEIAAIPEAPCPPARTPACYQAATPDTWT